MHKNTHSMLNKNSNKLVYLSLSLLWYVPRHSNHLFLKVFECHTFVSVCESLFNEHNQFALLRNQCCHAHAFPPTATQHTSERRATHKHNTTVIKLQINKCFTSIFELYLTDSFQREVIHSSGGYESSKNKIKDVNINWWSRNIGPNYCISEFKCDLNSNRLSSKRCIVFRVIIILYTIDLYVVFIPQSESKWNKIVPIQTMSNPKIFCLPPIANTLRDLDMRFTWVVQPPFKHRNLKWWSVSSLTLIAYSSDWQRHALFKHRNLKWCSVSSLTLI